MKIVNVCIYRCGDATDSPGYSCIATVSARGFEMVVSCGSPWLFVALLGGLWKAWRESRRASRSLESGSSTLPCIGMLALALTSSVAVAGDCRAVAQVKAVAVNHYGAANVVAYRQNYYAPTYYQAAIVAVEDPYSVHLLAPELRAKQRAKEQAAKVESLEETARQNTEAIRLLTQALIASKGGDASAGAGVLQSQADPVLPILRTKCAKCHTGDGSKGEFKLFEAGGAAVPFTPEIKLLVESVTNDNSMPPAGDKLTAEEYQAVRKWYEADRAAVRAAIKKRQSTTQPGELK